MSPKHATMRSDAKASPREILAIGSGADNGCTVWLPISETRIPSAALTFPPMLAAGWPRYSSRTADVGPKYIEHVGWRLYRQVDPHGAEMRPGLGRCWNWQGSLTGSGSVRQGQITWRERYQTPQKVHRVAWELWNGPIPADKQINHTCDNAVCVRLDHLYLGTQAENMKDGADRHRFHVPHVSSVLTPADREAIFATPGYRGVGNDLARRYGVTRSCISAIRAGRFIRPQRREHRRDDFGVPVQPRAGVLQGRDGGAQLID